MGIAYDNKTKRMYVTNGGDDTVSVLDTKTHTKVDVPVKNGPAGIAYDPVNKRMFVTDLGNGTVYPINLWKRHLAIETSFSVFLYGIIVNNSSLKSTILRNGTRMV